jgi:hypothetical protein
MSEPKLFPVVAGPAYTQEKPFPTQSIPRHFEAIVLPIVGLYCWGGLPYASGQVLFAVQDYSVASVLALFDSVLIFFSSTCSKLKNHVHHTFHLDLTDWIFQGALGILRKSGMDLAHHMGGEFCQPRLG